MENLELFPDSKFFSRFPFKITCTCSLSVELSIPGTAMSFSLSPYNITIGKRSSFNFGVLKASKRLPSQCKVTTSGTSFLKSVFMLFARSFRFSIRIIWIEDLLIGNSSMVNPRALIVIGIINTESFKQQLKQNHVWFSDFLFWQVEVALFHLFRPVFYSIHRSGRVGTALFSATKTSYLLLFSLFKVHHRMHCQILCLNYLCFISPCPLSWMHTKVTSYKKKVVLSTSLNLKLFYGQIVVCLNSCLYYLKKPEQIRVVLIV